MPSNKVTVVARIKAKEGLEDKVKQELINLLIPTRSEEGCINYDLHQSIQDNSLFLFYENWKTEEDLKRHLENQPLKNFLKQVDELLGEPLDVTLWSKIE
ncbi:MAG: putative quinol monooxygenase [Thermodesulfobacteriota bacterium]|jgi:quinol monooxygenase YgiN|nr:MAG: putative quinol monooxygenase [Thermodesulfobacteriota bacterium]